MELGEKLQELRRQRGLTQEELSARLYVSRTAISKWESGRGYPNIESLKDLAKFFSVTVDELLSTDEVLTLAEEENKQTETRFCDLIYGLLDVSAALLLFLPFFATRANGNVQSLSLLALDGIPLYLRAAYLAVVVGLSAVGILTLALQNCRSTVWVKCKAPLSLAFGTAAVLLFVISSQPYAAVFAFVLLAIKAFMRIKRQ